MKPDPILEECYRIKEEYSAQFKDVQSFFEHFYAQDTTLFFATRHSACI